MGPNAMAQTPPKSMQNRLFWCQGALRDPLWAPGMNFGPPWANFNVFFMIFLLFYHIFSIMFLTFLFVF